MVKLLIKILPIFTVFSILLLSGCVMPESGKNKITGKGIAITDFSSSREEVTGKNKPVRIYMEVENQGGYATNKILMCLIGSFGKISEGMWELKSQQCYKVGRTLEASDPVNNLPGGSARTSWTLSSPWIPYPEKRKDEFIGRVYYFYNSKSTAEIWVYSETEIEAEKQKGEKVSSIGEQTKTSGPIEIDISTPNLIRAEDGFFTVKITVSNVDGGVPFNSSAINWDSSTPPLLTVDNLNVVKLSISYPSSELKLEACENEIELRKGETRTISCDFQILHPESITTKKMFPISVEAEYGYYIDSTLSITIYGKKGETP